MHIFLLAPSRSRLVNIFIWSTVFSAVGVSTFFVYSTSQAAPVNLALNRLAVASSKYRDSYDARYVNDGKLTTRWVSKYSDPQWIYIDLGTSKAIQQVILKWEAAYGKAYTIQVSNNASTWTTVYTTTTGNGGTDTISLPSSTTGRYVRMYGTKRATQWGYSLYEFEVYGTPAPTATITAMPNSITKGQSTTIAWNSANASSCTGTSFSTGGAVSGSVTIAPVVTTTYSVSCSGPGGTANASATIHVTVPQDTTPPSVSMTAPLNGATVSGITTVSANASDDVGVVGVQFKLDGTNLDVEKLAVPYTVVWDTTGMNDGPHTLAAVARDAAGNTATSALVIVMVDNVPSITGTCEATPVTMLVGQTVIWTADVSGGTGSYDYVWSGTDGLIGTSNSLMVTYAASGSKVAQVAVTSGTKTATIVCGNTVTVNIHAGFGVADRIRVSAGDTSVNVRDAANGALVGQQADGALGTVIAGPVYANSLWWWNVDYDTAPDGWSAQDFLLSDPPPTEYLPVMPDNPDISS